MPTFKAGQCPDRELAMTNCIYCSPEDGDALRKGAGMFYVQINKEYTFQCKPNAKMTKGSLGFNQIQRKICALSLNADLNADVFDPPANNFMINSVAFTVDFPNKASATSDSIDAQASLRLCRYPLHASMPEASAAVCCVCRSLAHTS